MDDTATSQLAYDALARAVAGDAAGAATALQTIGQNSDEHRMYSVCCGFAEAGRLMLQRLYGDEAPTPGNGMYVLDELVPGAAQQDPPKAFAMRFLVAHANGHADTTLALFKAAAAASDEEYVDSVCALLADVAGITRLALKETR